MDGPSFGEETFAPVYEFGKSIKEIDLVWAPTMERKCCCFLLPYWLFNDDYSFILCKISYHIETPKPEIHQQWNCFCLSFYSDESCESAILTRPIKDYLNDSSDIDVMFGYTSAVNELFFFPI